MRSLRDGLIYQVQSLKAGFTPTILTSNQLIHLYSKHGLLHEAHKLFDEMPLRNVFSWNSIISAYIRSQNLTQARILFDSAAYRDLVTYNSMLSGYVSVEGYETHALSLFVEMQKEHDHIRIDEFTATTILNLFAKLSMESYGRQLHAFMVKTANDLSGFSVSSLVDMYSKCGCFKEAHNVFSGCGGVVDSVLKNAMVAACCREGEMEMALDLFWREPELNDAFSWNTLISGYAHNGYQEKALNLFVSMAKNGVRWNEQTFASVLNACSGLKSWKIGKEVHGWVLKNGMSSNPFISSGILDVYCKCGNMKYAELMHFACEIRNSFSICSLIVGHASQGNMAEARQLFNTLEEKNSVVWTALFSGYVKAQQSEAVFELLNEYRTKEAMTPDSLILISVLGACAIQAALDPGKQVHGYILRTDTEMDEKLISAMVDMYSKSGNITYAEKVFKLVTNRDSVLYNVMIAGYAHHGNEINAIQLFEDMLEKRIMPDAITFTALLSACRHCGLVQLGEKYFKSMTEVYNILPEIDHYTCMIDLYGRANQIEMAVAFMKKIPIVPDTVIWGAFLHACKINRNTEHARKAAEKLLKFEGSNGSRYVQLANVYAAEGNWVEMQRIRKQVKGKDVKKFAGCSWLYRENEAHVFTSGDTSHSKTGAIYLVLDCLAAEMYDVSGALNSKYCF